MVAVVDDMADRVVVLPGVGGMDWKWSTDSATSASYVVVGQCSAGLALRQVISGRGRLDNNVEQSKH